MSNILVIKLGALGDVFAATSGFEAIRKQHPDGHITLLTTKPFETFAKQLGFFDRIWIDDRPKLSAIKKLYQLRKNLRAASFSRVYDLQMVDRTNFYYYLMLGVDLGMHLEDPRLLRKLSGGDLCGRGLVLIDFNQI